MDIKSDSERNEEDKNYFPPGVELEVKKNFEKVSITLEPTESNTEMNAQCEAKNDIVMLVAQENEEIFVADRSEDGTIQNENINKNESMIVCQTSSNVATISLDSPNEVNLVLDEQNEKIEEINIEENEKIMQKQVIDDVTSDNVKNDCRVNNDVITENLDESSLKNYRNVILEDWEVEVPQIIANHEPQEYTETVTEQEEQQSQVAEVNSSEKIVFNNENCIMVNVIETNSEKVSNESAGKNKNSTNEIHVEGANTGLEAEIAKLMSDPKVESLKYSKSISNDDIVKILDESQEKIVKPIVTGKDLFFSIELAKRLNQNLAHKKATTTTTTTTDLDVSEKSILISKNNNCNNNNNMLDERQKIVEILEADEIKDWKSVPSKSSSGVTENGNDTDISKVIKNIVEAESLNKKPVQNAKKTPKKNSKIDKELARTIALQQLREEFPSTRKRSKTKKKVNQIPFLASTAIEKALTSPEVTTALKPGPPRRRPCYLPENISGKNNEKGKNVAADSQKTATNNNKTCKVLNDISDGSRTNSYVLDLELDGSVNSQISKNVVKTYVAKRKSTDTENEIKSTLETIAAVTKALSENSDESIAPKPKKQKTVVKPYQNSNTKKENKSKTKSILKGTVKIPQKRNLELEKLLGDEGAVRMLYETQHGESSASFPKRTKHRTTTRLKQDLMLKTKLVKNAVIRLSGGGTEGVSLRGNRRSKVTKPEVKLEPLFESTPNVVFHKAKKKQRADASRILYRHSSSESLDSSEGYRRTSFDADLSSITNKEESTCNNNKSEESNPVAEETEKLISKTKPKPDVIERKRLKWLQNSNRNQKKLKKLKIVKAKNSLERLSTDSSANSSKLNLSNVPVRKSSRPRMISKKYSVWSSKAMDSLSVESLGLKKLKKASPELGKKLNCKELTILQYENFVQVILNPVSVLLKNSFNVQVLQELTNVFTFLSEEKSCKAVLLSSGTNVFCQGIDINYIISLSDLERKNKVEDIVFAVEEFCSCLSNFNKPVIAGVQGAAVGLGVTILPYCDLIIASDKASFYTPYVRLGQSPEGAPTHTFPRINRLLVSELLFKSHKITPSDALKYGLITQLISEERFDDDVITITRNLAAQAAQGTESLRYLLRNNESEEICRVLRAEGEMLREHWCNVECLNNMVKFLESGELLVKQLDNT